ncbi:hypothetical protein CFter6_2789 [Collimonas fungivorans]|uniref:Uncharacterized protein n=1 Tax=Collimonas fungivorans TaxID=158899 RepID=A0A127PCJ7_9BURK|nr:hypothetical protein CFter6_2789 [Collimonas fungivorans]
MRTDSNYDRCVGRLGYHGPVELFDIWLHWNLGFAFAR